MRTRLPFVAVLIVLAGACSARRQPADLVIKGATVVDVQQGTTTPGRDIVVRGGRVVDVTADSSAYAPAHSIDATGAFVMPGLWDNHVHFGGGPALVEENRNLMPLYLAHGITTVRDAAGDLSESVLEWRTQVALMAPCRGRRSSPRGPSSRASTRSGRVTSKSGQRPMSAPRWTACRRCASTSSRSPRTR